jgi:2-polyprenyl-3-methyl-5-hydroxy-6-metoxy-1,4-benzoquinol methylase
MSNSAKLQDYWEKLYENTGTPFDAENPDEWIATLEQSGRIKGDVLDAGCGPGRTSIYLAGLGYNVTGIDISANAIARARQRAAQKNSTAQFSQANLFEITGYDNQFDTVVDIGCFHSLYDDKDRAAYATALHRLCRPGAIICLRAFSTRNPNEFDPKEHSPNLSEDQIRQSFEASSWSIEELNEQEIDLWISPEMTLRVWCWYAAIRRLP